MKVVIRDKEYEITPFACTNKGTFPFYINVTNKCNAKCSFCANTWHKEYRDLDLDFLKEILDIIQNSIHRISISGGEPLIEPNKLEEVLKIVNSYNRMITLNTNGKFLKDNIEMLNKYKIDSIQISRHHYEDEKNNEIFKTEVLPLEEINTIDSKAELNINCLLIKNYIDSKEEVIKFLESVSDTNISYVAFISMMQVNQYAVDNFVDYHDIIDSFSQQIIYIDGKKVYMEDGIRELFSYKDNDRCSCDNFLYTAKNGKEIFFYFRYTKDFGYSGRSLLFDCNGVKIGY